MKVTCEICPHHCRLDEGQIGICRARRNSGGTVVCDNYGKITSMALDPIEKKPLFRFYPGSRILSVGSYGCNLRCPFCQNSDISMAGGESALFRTVSPEELVKKAAELVPKGNIGIAYTYNEPLVGYEFVLDCAKLVHENGLKNVIVTNGTICEGPFKELLPLIDAMNIDLKSFTGSFYKTIGGDFETVKQIIGLAAVKCHVEVTTLIIPGENDSEADMNALALWLASLNTQIPLHITRFFPRYKMAGRAPTPVNSVYNLASVARRHLRYVYEGNC